MLRTPWQSRVTCVVALVLLLLTAPALMADPVSPMTITNIDSPDPVASATELTYSIHMVNTGGSKLTSVVLTDQLNGVGGIGVPPQLAITSSRGSCTQTTTLVRCSAGTIEGRGTWDVTIRGVVTAANGTTINNTASVAGTRSAQNFTSTTTATTLISNNGTEPLPDLTISKNGPTSVAPSAPLVYTLTVNNIGTANATDITVVDTVPAGLGDVNATGTSLFACTVGLDGRTVTCVGGAVNQGANATITIKATAPSAEGTITNTASVDPENAIPELNELNNSSALVDTLVTAAPPLPDLSINKTDDPTVIPGAGPDPVNPGGLLTYKIFVRNNSTQRADDVVVIDGTQGLEAASMTATQIVTNGTIGNTGGCFVAAPQARCAVRTLNPGGTILVTITGRVVASAGSTIINTATVTGNIRNKGLTATDSELTTVKPAIDLTITKADMPDPVCARSWPPDAGPPAVCRGGLRYTLVVGNSGTATASGVTVRDPLPPGTFLDHYTAAAFADGCNLDGANVLTCRDGSIAPESTTSIEIVLVAPPVTGPISNTATVDPANAIFESDETNNTATQATQVITGIDLTIDVDDVPPGFDPIATSGTQTYTITVDNIGTQDATNIRVRDTLPANTIFRSAVADNGFTCSHSRGIVECVGGSLLGTAAEFYPPFGVPGSDTATIIIRVFAQPTVTNPESGLMHNEVRVDPLNEIAEVNEANNIAFEDTGVVTGGASKGAFNQFTIAKTQKSPDKDDTARNAKVTYEITLTNDGTDPATGVVVRDYLPAGSRYIEATGTNKFNCSQRANYIDCVGGELAAGGDATITLTMFAPDIPGTYKNQAIVDPDNAIPEGNEFDNQAFETTVVTNAGGGAFYELNLTKEQLSPDATNTARGARVKYHLTVHNDGTDDVVGVVVRDTLPSGSRFIEATGTNQFLCSETTGVVTCVGGQIAHSGTATIDVTMYAPDTPGSYVNQAEVDPGNAIPEGDEENNLASATTMVVNGGEGAFNDLSITKTATKTVVPGGEITYAITVTNSGTDPALNVAMRDALPAGAIFVSAADTTPPIAPATTPPPGGFTCHESGGVVDCTGATLNRAPAAPPDPLPGVPNTRNITIKVKAPQANLDHYTNQAFVDPDNLIPEGDELNNTASDWTNVRSEIDLTITKDGPKTATQNETTKYTLKVTNTASAGTGKLAENVVVVDPLPVGLIPLAVNAGDQNNWHCSIAENPINLVRCYGDIPKGETIPIEITVFVTAESGRSLDNVACVDPDNLIVESEELNNCSEYSTIVIAKQPDLSVSKSVDSGATTPGANLTYTITVSNIGNGPATAWNGSEGLTVTDKLPDELEFTNVTTTNQWDCTNASGTITCHGNADLAPGASAQITILTRVKDTANAPIVNTAVAADALCSGDCENESKTENNTATISSSMGSTGFDLILSTITDTPDPVAPGQNLKYTIVAQNAGTANADSVHIAITIPTAGVTQPKADGSNGFNCSGPVDNVFDCVGTLPGGGNTVLTASFVMDLGSLPPDVTLSAEIDPGHFFDEANEGNNGKSETTTISGATCSSCVDLAVASVDVSPEPYLVGGPMTVTARVVNVGDLPTMLNTSNDALFHLMSISSGALGAATITSSDPGITCAADLLSTTNYTCKGNLAPGQGVTLTFDFPVNGGSMTFISAVADPEFKITEFNESNNSVSRTAWGF